MCTKIFVYTFCKILWVVGAIKLLPIDYRIKNTYELIERYFGIYLYLSGVTEMSSGAILSKFVLTYT